MTNRKLIALIGEIDGIRLQTAPNGALVVYLDIRGEQLEVIRDGGQSIDHLITREGIRSLLDPRSSAQGIGCALPRVSQE